MARARKHRTLHVVFDTNSLFTSSIRELFNSNAVKLLRQNNHHVDVEVKWLVPAIVRHEREYQMREEARKHLTAVGKLENLIGMNWGVNADSIGRAVTQAVDAQLDELKVRVLPLDTTLVEWDALIDASVLRLPPFDKGEKEKGFRDAIVCETFVQLVNSLPSGTREQAVIVTGDALLTDAVKARIQGIPNAKIVADLEGLQGTLNIMLSQVQPEFAQELVGKANVMFFVGGETNTMYYSQKVDEAIKAQFPEPFLTLPAGAQKISVVRSVMHPTNFVRKEGQRVFFVNRLIYELKATRIEISLQNTPQLGMFPPDQPIRIGEFGANHVKPSELIAATHSIPNTLYLSRQQHQNALTALRNEVTVANRAVAFDIHWSATLTKTHKLINESINDYQQASLVDSSSPNIDDLA